jgi:hypothetical protein
MIVGSVKDLLEMGDVPLLGGKIKESIQGRGELVVGDRHTKALVVVIIISNIVVSEVAHVDEHDVSGLVGVYINDFAIGGRAIFTKLNFGIQEELQVRVVRHGVKLEELHNHITFIFF